MHGSAVSSGSSSLASRHLFTAALHCCDTPALATQIFNHPGTLTRPPPEAVSASLSKVTSVKTLFNLPEAVIVDFCGLISSSVCSTRLHQLANAACGTSERRAGDARQLQCRFKTSNVYS